MFNFISRKLTNKYKEVPLLYIMFDLNKYKKFGKKGSCELKIHPNLRDDMHLIQHLNELVDYVRDNYDMENLSK